MGAEFLENLDLLGAPVFILRPGKMIKGLYTAPKGWQNFTVGGNTARLRSAEARCGYGMVCGHVYDVLDVDPRNGGKAGLQTLVEEGCIPPVRWVVRTLSGGWHLYIDPLEAGKHPGFLPGVDLQAAGSFVFIPPTDGYRVLPKEEWPELGDPSESAIPRLFARVNRTTAEPKPGATARQVPEELIEERVARTLQSLDDLAGLRDGERLPWPGVKGGVGWDVGGLYAAARLIEAANSSTEYTLDAARRDFLAHSPAGGTYNPTHKWAEALKYVGNATMPYEPPAAVFSVMTDEAATAGEIHSGQVRMAYRLADSFAGKLLYVRGIGWHHWDGRRWALDERGHAERAVISILQDAIPESNNDKKLRNDIIKCDSAGGIKGVLEVAAILEPFAYTPDMMDADPFLVNCANGTLDLRDRVLRPHNPHDQNTKIATGAYDQTANKTIWRAFLDRILPDPEERDYLQRVIGQAVYGGVREHLFPVLTGKGANGKGTVYGAICNAFGDYAAIINPDMLMMHDRGGVGGPEMMVLRGARLVVASELGQDKVLDDALMKRLTGGDLLTARHLFREPVTWRPSHQLVYVSNHKPKTRGDDDAVWRRMRIIPFDVVIPDAEQDPTLGETLTLHADAILTWAVDGFFDREDNGGMREPAAVLVATQTYQYENDAIKRFLEDRCEVRRDHSVLVSELWIAWLTWRDDEGGEMISKKAFGVSLENRGFRAGTTGENRIRCGLRLRKDSDEDIL